VTVANGIVTKYRLIVTRGARASFVAARLAVGPLMSPSRDTLEYQSTKKGRGD
jgi:hypothetical protein